MESLMPRSTDNIQPENTPSRSEKVKEKVSIEDSRISNLTFQKFLLLENICLTVTYISLF